MSRNIKCGREGSWCWGRRGYENHGREVNRKGMVRGQTSRNGLGAHRSVNLYNAKETKIFDLITGRSVLTEGVARDMRWGKLNESRSLIQVPKAGKNNID